MEIDADSDGVGARVLVRDFGGGIQPRSIAVEERTLGLGLPLIATLSRSFSIRGRPDLRPRGRDGVRAQRVRRLRRTRDEPAAARVTHSFDAPRAAGMLIQPGPLVAPVTSRVTAILAARADFPLDRLADAVLVSDAIAAHASEYIAGSDVGRRDLRRRRHPRLPHRPARRRRRPGPAARDGSPRPGPVAGTPGGRGQRRTRRLGGSHGTRRSRVPGAAHRQGLDPAAPRPLRFLPRAWTGLRAPEADWSTRRKSGQAGVLTGD